MNTMYVALRVEEFAFECVSQPHIRFDIDAGKAKGCLLVYSTLEDLREEYPGADYICIQESHMVPRAEGKCSID